MAHVDLRQLVGRLNTTTRAALEAAVALCVTRTNYNVEIEHWLLKLLEQSNTDFVVLLRQCRVDQSRLAADLTRAIDALPTGSSRAPGLSPDIVALIREAWLIGSIDYGASTTRSGYVLCALVSDESFARLAAGASAEFAKVTPDAVRQQIPQVLPKTDEGKTAGAGEVPVAGRPAGSTSSPALDQFTIDLTQRAREGLIDPVVGRDVEIRQIVDILTRRRQNNPILTGEAGVGKTAVAEGFALRIAAGDVPPSLEHVSLRSLDLGLLQAGAGVKGEFENRLKSVINEVKASPKPIVLFIDEAHTLIGAGGGAGQGDAANLLKPALARGELRTIAATTWAEYKKYFEKDAALTRRFQLVKIDEPDEARAVGMLRGSVETLERHHNVRIMNEALLAAVRLSSRYISDRQLPDKAMSVLDTTCARIGLSRTATPPAIEDCRRQIEQIDVTVGILSREAVMGADHAERLARLAAEKTKVGQELSDKETRWTREREIVDAIATLRSKIEGTDARETVSVAPAVEGARAGGGERATAPASQASQPAGDKRVLLDELKSREEELRTVQGETPLVHAEVNSQAISETVAAWTGIPVGRMMADQITTVLNLKSLMERQIVGQSHALERIAQSIQTSRANLTDPRTPIGVFLLAGTSGVGKTETAIVLSELLYGGPQNMTVINMSEFKEEHKVSLLMGSPPGYVGYGEGGVLTEAVRRKPYSVVLLDEMEKAHPGVQDIFYQVFDKGTLRDGEGRDIDFKNTIILMTTNAGTDLIKSLCADPDTAPDPDAFAAALHPELMKTFKPAFLGRVTVVPYYPLSDAVMRKIIALKLGKIGQRVQEHYRATFTYAPELVDTIARRCAEVDTGARNIDHILTRTLLPQMSAEFLARLAEGKGIRDVWVTVGDDETFRYDIG
jgi:type VI secretion system protein VasG